MQPFPQSKLSAAVYLFEKPNRPALDPSEEKDLQREGLADANAEQIAAQIRATLDSGLELTRSYRTTAFFALGKRFDPSLMGFFRKHLGVEIERDMHVAYQIMIALDNLEEPVWPEHQHSFSSSEHEVNRKAAQAYLRAVRD